MTVVGVLLILTILSLICEPWEMVILVAFVVLFAPSDAEACHRYHVWKYPKPQHCAVALARDVRLPHKRIEVGLVEPKAALGADQGEASRSPAPPHPLALPALDFTPADEADEYTRSRLLLRFMLMR
jgi:hypothetical protein